MLEIVPDGTGGWLWRWISADGRTLMEQDGYPTDWDAIVCAKDYRVRFWLIADQIDHRMGRCI